MGINVGSPPDGSPVVYSCSVLSISLSFLPFVQISDHRRKSKQPKGRIRAALKVRDKAVLSTLRVREVSVDIFRWGHADGAYSLPAWGGNRGDTKKLQYRNRCRGHARRSGSQMLAPEYMQRCIDLGFNRVSFGVQSNDESLRKRIGRGDKPHEYPALIALIRKLSSKININVDLLACLPEQTFESLQTDIEVVKAWAVNSVDVLYYVMLPGTRLRTLIQLGERAAPDYGQGIVNTRNFVNSSLRGSGFSQLTGEVFVRDDEDRFVRSSYGGGGDTLNTVLALGPSAFGLAGARSIKMSAISQNICRQSTQDCCRLSERAY